MVLALRFRPRDEGGEGTHAASTLRDESARITRGSYELLLIRLPLIGTPPVCVNDRAVGLMAGVKEELVLPRTPWLLPSPRCSSAMLRAG